MSARRARFSRLRSDGKEANRGLYLREWQLTSQAPDLVAASFQRAREAEAEGGREADAPRASLCLKGLTAKAAVASPPGGVHTHGESLGAKEQPEREELSEWSRNGGIRAQRALAAAQVTTFVTEKEAGRGKSI